MSKRWDFSPEPIHERIAAGALEKELLQELGNPESAEDLQAILAAARQLMNASTSFVSRKVQRRENIGYFANRIATGALRKAMRSTIQKEVKPRP